MAETKKPNVAQVTIEAVKTSEAAILVEVSRKTFYDSFYLQNKEADMDLFLEHHLTAATIDKEMSTPENLFFFARVAGEIAGYLKLTDGKKPRELQGEALEIARIYVLEEKIGLGIGKALMQFALSFAAGNNKRQVWLGVWEHNQRAIDFYEGFGFEKFGEHIFLLGTDAQTDWLMKKQLQVQ